MSVWLLSSEVRSRSRTFTDRSRKNESQQKPKSESSLKLTAVEGWRDGELAEGRRRRRLSLSVLCSALSVQTCRWRRGREGTREGGGGSAVFSRGSFLCVGLMAPSGGQDPQSNLLSPQNTLCYKTHTPSGTNSALNFLPVILAAGQRKKQLPNSEKSPDNHPPLGSRVNNLASRYKRDVV